MLKLTFLDTFFKFKNFLALFYAASKNPPFGNFLVSGVDFL